MGKRLDRKTLERVWNILNEIKEILPDKLIELPLLGGLALKAKEEGCNAEKLKQALKLRIKAFKIIESLGVITIKKMPKASGIKGVIQLKLTSQKAFDNYYKSCEKTYHHHAQIYQAAHPEKKTEKEPNDLKLPGEYKVKDGYGYLVFGDKEIKIAKENTQQSRFVKFFWHKDYYNAPVTKEAAFEYVLEKKAHESATVEKELTILLRGTFKEVQRILIKNGVDIFAFSTKSKGTSPRSRQCKLTMKFSKVVI